ncbi:MAG: SEC-C metal-binding domain-containing protein, partial [Bacteroidales bacterium]|nr:SEC-C metal-binding domain-containing protein [Bacteroidales bacterium]
REVIYTRRRHALFGERMDIDIINMIQDSAFALITDAKQAGGDDFEAFRLDVLKTFAIALPFSQEEFEKSNVDALAEKLYKAADEAFHQRCDTIVSQTLPAIKQVYENPESKFKNILFPITDGQRLFKIPVNLKAAYDSNGKEVIKSIEKVIMLIAIDDAWREHLRQIDELRKSVQNASYEQKDPLLIYKFESFNLFKGMIESINSSIVCALTRLSIAIPQRSPEEEEAIQQQRQREMQAEQARRRLEMERLRMSHEDAISGPSRMPGAPQGAAQHTQPIKADKKVGRNDPCPCGSGKKYKNCCGKGLPE